MNKSDDRLTALQLVVYAAPMGVVSLALVPVSAVLPTMYAKYALVPLTSIGIILTLRSVYDALSDQVIGFLSDRTRTSMGSRIPWVIAGTALILLGIVFLYRIPADAGALYFAFWTLIFYTGYTMFNIPHLAWGHELSTNYTERARIFGFRGFADNTGSMLFSIIPIVLVYLGWLSSEEYTPETVWMLGLIIIMCLPIVIASATFWAPRTAVDSSPRTTFKGLLRSGINNRPFHRFILAYFLAGTGYGFFVALIFPYISTYLMIGEAFSYIILIAAVSSLVSIPIWIRIVGIVGKHRAWAYGWLANSSVMFPLFFIEPGESAVIPMAICMGLYGMTNGVSAVAPFAILSDVIDYDILKTGVDRGGNYYAFMMFVVKLLGSAGGIALVLLGSVFGYEVSEGHVNSDFANMGMVIMFIGLPAFFQLASLPLIWNFPLNARRHDIIRRRLERRNASRSASADPVHA